MKLIYSQIQQHLRIVQSAIGVLPQQTSSVKLLDHLESIFYLLEQEYSQPLLGVGQDPPSSDEDLHRKSQNPSPNLNDLRKTQFIQGEVEQNYNEEKENMIQQCNRCFAPESVSASRTSRGPYQICSQTEKQQVLEQLKANKYNYTLVAKEKGLKRKTLIRWVKFGCGRKQGQGRKPRDPEMEIKLEEWLKKRFLKSKDITTSTIRKKAIQFSTNPQFRASRGWANRFLKRYNYS